MQVPEEQQWIQTTPFFLVLVHLHHRVDGASCPTSGCALALGLCTEYGLTAIEIAHRMQIWNAVSFLGIRSADSIVETSTDTLTAARFCQCQGSLSRVGRGGGEIGLHRTRDAPTIGVRSTQSSREMMGKPTPRPLAGGQLMPGFQTGPVAVKNGRGISNPDRAIRSQLSFGWMQIIVSRGAVQAGVGQIPTLLEGACARIG
ncbi:hypothetical protein N7492_004075 [Penicillium capsulatum]|uniref:Uncharacterized protein n=1 Tax=Penicillium capsulatum TaxID=69766 RepID=A0A9W9LX55_9EURO|nr:hypothetical protein N7492_004075 [Penicillium capsulatum]KAJ6121352.1 hypothetical protein N7512_003817 [Penicillium capsulatum]